MKRLIITITIFGIVALAYLALHSTPPADIPASAKNVRFYESGGWQSWKFVLKFEDTPIACEAYARKLMVQQNCAPQDIVKTPFTSFPVDWSFPVWFDVETVKNGILLTGDDWIYAVIDLESGKLYYYNSI